VTTRFVLDIAVLLVGRGGGSARRRPLRWHGRPEYVKDAALVSRSAPGVMAIGLHQVFKP
jgi:hypothetical protein